MLWGEGNCVGDGLAYKEFLLQTASYGIMIIANGWVKDIPGRQKQGRDTTKDMKYFTDSITWIESQAGKAGSKYETVNATLLGASGHSCGGLQTIEMRSDKRIKTLASFGYATRESVWARDIVVPVGFFVGSLDTSIAMPRKKDTSNRRRLNSCADRIRAQKSKALGLSYPTRLPRGGERILI